MQLISYFNAVAYLGFFLRGDTTITILYIWSQGDKYLLGGSCYHTFWVSVKCTYITWFYLKLYQH
jgi:hypothetical protein